MINICSKPCVDKSILSGAYIHKCQNGMVFFYTKSMQKLYANKPQKIQGRPLRNAAHGDKREDRARNAVKLCRSVQISRE